jgi:WD40 repeat protein
MIILANVQSDRMVHVFTIYSVLLVLIGFLFLSFDVLGRREGPLRWLIRVIVPGLVIGILCSFLANRTPSSSRLGPVNLREIMESFVLYGSLVAMLCGLFTHAYDIQEKSASHQQSSNTPSLIEGETRHSEGRRLLKIRSKVFMDGFIGFIFASFYGSLAIWLIIHWSPPLNWKQFNGWYAVWSCLTFVALGTAGGASWRLLHRSSPTATGKPPIFSPQDCLKGLTLWSLVCFLIWFLIASLQTFDALLLLLFGTMGLVAVGGFLSGCSQSFARRVAVHRQKGGLLFWLVTWLVIWAMISSALIWAVPITEETLAHVAKIQSFVGPVLLGTAITVAIGALVYAIARLVFWWANIHLFRNHFLPIQDARNINSSQQETLHAYFFPFLRDNLIFLASWYEIWFIFPVTLILYTFFHTMMSITIVLLLGIGITVGSIGVFRLISWWRNKRRVASSDQMSSLLYSRKRATILLSWPPMWVGIWIVAVMTVQSLLNITKPIDLLELSLLVGTIVTILIASLVIGIVSLCPWLLDKLRSMLLRSMHAFLSMNIRHNTFLRSIIRKHTESTNNRPPLFSLRDSCIGLVFWPATWFASTIIVFSVSNLWQVFGRGSFSDLYSPSNSEVLSAFSPLNILNGPGFNSLSIFVAIAIVGTLIGGLSRFICWESLNFKHLGTLGAIITIFGLGLQLVEPTQAFLSPILPQHGHNSSVVAVAWSPNGGQIASASSDSPGATVQVWNTKTEETDFDPPSGNESRVVAVAWSPNGELAFSYSTHLEVWNAANQRRIFETYDNNRQITSMAWSPDGRYLAYPGNNDSSDGYIDIWDPLQPPGIFAALMPDPKRHTIRPIRKLAWSPNGNYIAAVDNDGTVLVWSNFNDKKAIYSYGDHTGKIINICCNPKVRVNAIAWSYDSRHLAFAGKDETVRIWDATARNNPIIVFHNHAAPVNDVAWSPDRKRIASASSDGTVRVWNAVDGKEAAPALAHDDSVNSVAWSPHGNRLATASDDRTVKIWDSSSWSPIHTYKYSGSQ